MLDEGLERLQPPSQEALTNRARLEESWELWLPAMFPNYITDKATGKQLPWAEHQRRYWDHVWHTIQPGVRPQPYVAIWGRGLTKSTSAEMTAVAEGARRVKKYCLYVCGAQEQADDHVSNVGDMLGTDGIETYYPELSSRDVSKYGASRGWRRNRLRTAAGYTIDAMGLDTARSRGAKLDEYRPDIIIFDDLDDQEDKEAAVLKKVRAITRKILPAGADDLAVIFIQNLVHEGSIARQLEDGTATWLADRIVDGPIDVVVDLDYDKREYQKTGRVTIRGGKPAWAGIPLARAQKMARDEGGEAFLVERCNRLEVLGGLIYKEAHWADPARRYHIGQPIPHPYLQDGTEDQVIGRGLFFDTAYTDEDSSSDTAVVALELLSTYRLRLSYLDKAKVEFPALLRYVTDEAEYHNQDGALSWVVVENKGSGISALQTLYLAADPELADILDGFDPGNKSKDQRDKLAATYTQAGGVLLPWPSPEVPMLGSFMTEQLFKASPNPRDVRDAFTMGILYLEKWVAEWHKGELQRLVGLADLDYEL